MAQREHMTDRLCSEPPRGGKILLAVVLGAIVFRAVLGLWVLPPDLNQQENWGQHHTSDYWAIGGNLAAGRGYSLDGEPTADLTPAYPLLIAGSRALFGDRAEPILLLQALLAGLTALLLFRLGGRIYGRGAGLWAAAIYAFYPYLARIEASLFEASLYTLGLIVVMTAIFRCARRQRAMDALLAGLALGGVFLVRPTVGAFAPLASLWLYFLYRGKGRACAHVALMALVSVLVISPWVVRNYRVFDRLVISRTNGGQNLWFGNNEYLEKVYPDYTLDCLKPLLRQEWRRVGPSRPRGMAGEFAFQEFASRRALEHIRSDPGQFLRRFLLKVGELYHWRLSPVYENFPRVSVSADGRLVVRDRGGSPVARGGLERWAYAVTYIPLCLLAVPGLVLSRGRFRLLCPILLLIGANTILYGIYFGTTKNRAPFDTFLMLLAGHALVRVWAAIRRRRPGGVRVGD